MANEEQRAIKREIETPADRLDRARRVVLRMLEIRETNPIVKKIAYIYNIVYI